MRAFRRYGIPAAALLVALVMLLLRKGAAPDDARPAAPAARSKAERRTAARSRESLPEPALPVGPFPSTFPRTMPRELPADVPSGPFSVEGPGEEPDALKDLSLSASQRIVIDALVARRDAALDEIRREIDARAPKGADVDRLCARATAAQEGCLSSIRSALLPEQKECFERLVKSGRWGGMTLVIPMTR